MPDIKAIFGIAAAAIAAIALGACALLLRDNISKATKISEMTSEIHTRDLAEKATNAALIASIAQKDKVSREYTTIIQKLPPTGETCRTDPAIVDAYAGIQRMRNAGSDKVRPPLAGPPG